MTSYHWSLRVAATGLALLGVLAVQVSVLGQLPLWGVHGNLPLAVVIVVGLVRGPVAGVAVGLAAGALVDLYTGTLVGAQAVLMAGAGYVAAAMGAKVFRDHVFIPVAASGALTFLFEAAYLALANAFGLGLSWQAGLVRVAVPTAVYNTILAPLVYILTLRLLGWARDEFAGVNGIERSR